MDNSQTDFIFIPKATEKQLYDFKMHFTLPEKDRPSLHKYLTPEQWLAAPDSIFGIPLSFDDKYRLVVDCFRPDSSQTFQNHSIPAGMLDLYVNTEGYLVRDEFDSINQYPVLKSEVVVIRREDKQVMIIPLPEDYIVMPGNMHLHMDDPRLIRTLDSVPDMINGHVLSVIEKSELATEEVVLGGEHYRLDSVRILVHELAGSSGSYAREPVTYKMVSYGMPEIAVNEGVPIIPLTERQLEALKKYVDGFEISGMTAGFPEIHQTQLLSVPDRVGQTYFDQSDKVDLLTGKLTGTAEFNRFGEAFYLNGQHQIVRIAMSEDLSIRKELVTRKEVSFNYLTLKNSEIMNAQNFDYLKMQLRYLGFGDALNSQLEAAIKNPEIRDFSLRAQAEKPTKMGNMSQFEMYFNQNENSENYYFPRYRTDLLDRDGNVSRSNYFGVYQTKSIKAMESVNMLEGRSVKTTRDTGTETAVVYARLDFNKRTQHGNYKTEYFNEKNYGINVMAILDKSHVIFENEEAKQKIATALEKGNLVEGRYWLNGKAEEGFLALNTQYKNLDYFHEDLRPVYSKLLGEHPQNIENNNGVDVAPEEELGMRNVEIISAPETEQLLKSVMNRGGSLDHPSIHIAELTGKQQDKVMNYFQEGIGAPPALSPKQMASVPDTVDGNVLTNELKQQLLYGLEVQVATDLKYQVTIDRSIDRIIQGEETSHISKVLPGDVSFSEAKSNDLKPWEDGKDEEIAEKTGISR